MLRRSIVASSAYARPRVHNECTRKHIVKRDIKSKAGAIATNTTYVNIYTTEMIVSTNAQSHTNRYYFGENVSLLCAMNK